MQRSFDGAHTFGFVDVEFLLCDRGKVFCDSQSDDSLMRRFSRSNFRGQP